MNILDTFFTVAAQYATRTAIVEPSGRTITYEALVHESALVAENWSQRGIITGNRVLVAMPLGIDLYIALAALWRLGAVAVFPEPALGLAGVRHAARTTSPQAFLGGGKYRLLRYIIPELWKVPAVLSVSHQGVFTDRVTDVSPDAPALISFTSGSTGLPKAIVRSHRLLAEQNARVHEFLFPVHMHEIDLVAFPVFVIANLSLGITSVLPNWNLRRHDKADSARLLTYMKEQTVTRALIPPSICEKLVSQSETLPLSTIFTGGGPVFPDIIERLQNLNSDMEIVLIYGSTEAEPIAHISSRDIMPEDWQAMKKGAGLLAGPPIGRVQLMIRDDEIIVTGDHVNKGYLDSKQDISTKIELEGDIWHRTGDAGRLDADGRLWLLGRVDGKVGATYPFMIETAARFWPGVTRSALIDINGKGILVLEGDASHFSLWQRQAETMDGITDGLTLRHISAIPLDKRHRSKIDYVSLRKMLNAS